MLLISIPTVKIKRQEGQKKPLMVVVSTKVSKKATERNLLKRRIKAIMRPITEKEGKNYKVITRPGAATLSFWELEKEIKKQLEGRNENKTIKRN